MTNLIAVLSENTPTETLYHFPVLISSYEDAVQYEISTETNDLFSIEYLKFHDDVNLSEVIDEIHNEWALIEEYEEYYNIREVQSHFGITEHTDHKWNPINVGDIVLVNPNDFVWGTFIKKEVQGVVTNLGTDHLVQVMLDGLNREVLIPHYKVKLHE